VSRPRAVKTSARALQGPAKASAASAAASTTVLAKFGHIRACPSIGSFNSSDELAYNGPIIGLNNGLMDGQM